MTQSIIKTLLKDKQKIQELIFHPEQWNKLSAQLLAISIIGIAIYGFTMGTYVAEWQHCLKISYKAIILIWGSIALSTPALYVFTSLTGSSSSLKQIVFLLLGALATTGLVLTGFMPIVWFFTWCTKDLVFVRLMHSLVIFISLSFGLYYLQQGLKLQKDGIKKGSFTGILFLWLLILMAVVGQMAFKLSPWFESFQGWW